MSIIAETLQRLQTHTKAEEPESSEPLSLVLPPRGKREPGWHTRPSRGKFWFAGLGIFVGLSSLALGAYWIGMSWDFGLSTYASPGTGYFLSPSESGPIRGIAPSGFPTDEFLAMPEEPPFQEISFSFFPRSEEGTSQSREPVLSQGSASPEILGPPKQENQLSEPPKVHTPVSENKTSPTPIPVSQAQSQVMPAAKTTPIRTAEFSPQQERAEKISPIRNRIPSIGPLQQSPLSILTTEKQYDREISLPEEAPFEGEDLLSRSGQTPLESSPHSLENHDASPPSAPENTISEASLQTPLSTVPVSRSMTDRLRLAQQSIQSGQYADAIASLSPLFRNSPDDWEPWFWMGTALLGQNDLEQADQYFLNGLARNDKIPQLWIQRALVAHQRGEYQLAIHELRRAESLSAGLPHTYLNMGYAYEKLGNTRLANEYYGRFLKVSEGKPTFFSTRKKLYAHFTDQMDSTPAQPPPSSLPKTP
jgi:TolA-binding protein